MKLSGIFSFLLLSVIPTQFVICQGLQHYWMKNNLSPTGSSGFVNVADVQTDKSGNIIQLGEFRQTIDFDPGPGIFNLTSPSTSFFIQKLDPSGNLLWVKAIEIVSSQSIFSLAIDPTGNIYATGYFTLSTDFDPGPGTDIKSPYGYSNIFIFRLDPNRNYLGTESIGDFGAFASGSFITFNEAGNMFLAGEFTATVDFDTGPSIYNISAGGGGGGRGVFIAKYKTDGKIDWVKALSGSCSSSSISALEFDPSGNIYATGGFQGIMDFDPSSATYPLYSDVKIDAYLVKLSEYGQFLWAHKYSGSGENVGVSLSSDAAGNISLFGTFEETIDFDPDTSTIYLTSTSGSKDIFLQKRDPAGNLLWLKQIGGIEDDIIYDVEMDAGENNWMVGQFKGEVDFDPGTGSWLLNSGTKDNAFYATLDAMGNFVWATKISASISSEAKAICTDPAGDFIISGNHHGTVSSTLGGVPVYLNSASFGCNFINKLSILTAISEAMPDFQMVAYPNPSNGLFTLHSGNVFEEAIIQIYSSSGILAGEYLYTHTNEFPLTIDGPAGIYILTITNPSGKMQALKIVKY